MMMTQDRLLQLLHYDPDTGVFRWVVRRGNIPAGSVAGNINKCSGYRQIGIDGKLYYAHRLASLYMTGAVPEFLDHANRDRGDNRWANIRPATKAQNNFNKDAGGSTVSGVRGVHWCKATRKWRAVISIGNRPKHLGRYATKEEAANAYQQAASRLHGEFAVNGGAGH